MKNATYEKVFETIVEEMEKGNAVWVRDWKGSNGLPKNAITGSSYRGGNSLALMVRFGKTSGWLTYLQATKAGCVVRRGEKGASVYFMSHSSGKDKDDKGHFFAKHYIVFNVGQLEEVTAGALKKLQDRLNEETGNNFSPIEEIEKLVNETKVDIGSGSPSYSQTADFVFMPDLNSFQSPERYYATLFHEMIHWTGHSSRLNRIASSKFGSEEYAFEELVAELGASFLSARFGIETVTQSGAYLRGWSKACRQHADLLPKAASLAQKAVDFLLAGEEQTKEVSESEKLVLLS